MNHQAGPLLKTLRLYRKSRIFIPFIIGGSLLSEVTNHFISLGNLDLFSLIASKHFQAKILCNRLIEWKYSILPLITVPLREIIYKQHASRQFILGLFKGHRSGTCTVLWCLLVKAHIVPVCCVILSLGMWELTLHHPTFLHFNLYLNGLSLLTELEA